MKLFHSTMAPLAENRYQANGNNARYMNVGSTHSSTATSRRSRGRSGSASWPKSFTTRRSR